MLQLQIDSDSKSTGSNPHISFVVSRWGILSLENPSADRYIRLLASNPLPLLIDKIIREASCLEVTRELETDFLAASLLTDVNLQLVEADAKKSPWNR